MANTSGPARGGESLRYWGHLRPLLKLCLLTHQNNFGTTYVFLPTDKKFVGEGTMTPDRRCPRQKTSCGRKGLKGPDEAARVFGAASSFSTTDISWCPLFPE